MRHRVALALLVATCAARFVSSTSMDDRVNKKTGTEDDESRMFGSNTIKSIVSKTFGGTKSAGAADDALVNAGKNGGTKVDDVGDDAKKLVKAGDDAAEGTKKMSGRKKGVIVGLVAVMIAGMIWWFIREKNKPAVAPTKGGSTAMVGTTGSAAESSSSLATDSLSGFAMDDLSGSPGLAMDDLSGSLKD